VLASDNEEDNDDDAGVDDDNDDDAGVDEDNDDDDTGVNVSADVKKQEERPIYTSSAAKNGTDSHKLQQEKFPKKTKEQIMSSSN
jgi:hypothetical protein